MLWRQDNTRHYAFFADNGSYRWFVYPPGEPPNFACSDAEARGRPRRGFSRVWCQEPGVRDQIGDATNDEIGDYRPLQEFDKGFMVYVKERGTVLTVYYDGTWTEQP